MVDRDREARKAPPAVLGDRVDVGERRVPAARDEAADDHDPVAEDRRGDLGPSLRERGVPLPAAPSARSAADRDKAERDRPDPPWTEPTAGERSSQNCRKG